MDCQTAIQMIADVVTTAAAATAAIVAFRGLKTWKQEIKGKAHFETAHALLAATFKLRDEIHSARSPFIADFEFPAEYDPLSKDPIKKRSAYMHVYTDRLKPVITAYQNFEVNLATAEALWGRSMREQLDKIVQWVRRFRTSIDAYIIHIEDIDSRKADDMFAQSVKCALFRQPERDEFSESMEREISKLETTLLPYLGRP